MPIATSIRGLVAALAGFAASPALAEGVRIVDAQGDRNFADIQSAVDAAVDGDVLLVAPGKYAGFTLAGKSLTLLAAPGGSVELWSAIELSDLQDETVAIVGFDVPDSSPALRVTNARGQIRLQDCSFAAAIGTWYGSPGFDAGAIQNSANVLLVRCSFLGSDGLYLSGGPDGGHGLALSASRIAAYECEFRGGQGGDGCDESGDGGDGLRAVDSWLFAAGCDFRGGHPGDLGSGCYGWLGFEGAGLRLEGASSGYLLDSTSSGTSGPVTMLSGERRAFDLPAIVIDEGSWTLAVDGVAGDELFLGAGLAPHFEFLPQWHGVNTVFRPFAVEVSPLGVVPVSGSLQLQIPAARLPGASARLAVHRQGVGLDAQANVYLGTPLVSLVLNRDSPPDCNGNSIQDYAEVLEGLAPDCNHDLIPDECETFPAPGTQAVLWGFNPSGQYTVPALPPGLAYVELAAGGTELNAYTRVAHVLARRDDGSVVGWGNNSYGQSSVPALPPGLTYVEIAAGAAHSLARRADGSVVAWGDGIWGQTSVPALPSGLTYVEIAAGMRHSMARRSDGSIVVWGDGTYGQGNVPALPTGLAYVEVAAGRLHNVARRSDGSVVAWGWNAAGQCDVPAPPPGLVYVEVAAGGLHSLARLSDGTVVAWGNDLEGQCSVPALPPGLTYVEVEAGLYHSLARRSDGSVVAFGMNWHGQCTVPVLECPGSGYVELAAGAWNSLGRY